MRQALTAKGQLDAWMRSSEAALANMGVEDIMVDENSLHIEGKHPEHGPIGIDYMIPEMGKTRMVIQVDDPKMITAFKRAVTPVFKNVIKELEKLEEEQMQQAEAKINADQPGESESEPQAQEPEAQEDESPETDKIDYKPEPSEEAGPEEAAESAQSAAETVEEGPAIAEAADKPVKKKKKGPMIALIVIAIVVVAAAASYFLYFRDHGLPFTKNSNSTTSSSSKSSNKDSSSNSSSTSSSSSNTNSQSTADNNNNGTTAAANSNTTANAGTITKAQYDQINNGMTYDQVKQIIGSDGSKLSESTYKDAQGNTVNVQIFYWQGNGSSDSNANITFQGNTVASKSSYGLK